MLLDRGADCNMASGQYKDTPLVKACKSGNAEIVNMLLDNGADCTSATQSGTTPLGVARQWGRKEIETILLSAINSSKKENPKTSSSPSTDTDIFSERNSEGPTSSVQITDTNRGPFSTSEPELDSRHTVSMLQSMIAQDTNTQVASSPVSVELGNQVLRQSDSQSLISRSFTKEADDDQPHNVANNTESAQKTNTGKTTEHEELLSSAESSLTVFPHAFLEPESDCADEPDIPNPMFSEIWQFEGTFTSSGGNIQGCDSDVVLSIPPDAIDECYSQFQKSSTDSNSNQDLFHNSFGFEHYQPDQAAGITIHGAISTDLQRVHQQLHLEEDEKICSPVAEYFAGKDFRFHKPVCIRLPHFLPEDIHKTEIRVYQIQEGEDGTEMRISTVQLLETTNEESNDFKTSKSASTEGFCWENGQICIFTTHFSAYFCTHCKKEMNPPKLYLRLYAKYFQKPNTTDVNIKLFIWDTRLEIRDFRKVRLTIYAL
jgi:hypothetical protein